MSIPMAGRPQSQIQYAGAPPQQPLFHPGVMPGQAQYAPMTQQPQGISQVAQNQMSANTNVIFNQKQIRKRQWISGLAGCCDDVTTCLSVFFCPFCMECYLSNRMGERYWMPLLVPLSLFPLRIKLRLRNKIKGSLRNDFTAAACCWCCALCQMKREHDLIAKTVAKIQLDQNANAI